MGHPRASNSGNLLPLGALKGQGEEMEFLEPDESWSQRRGCKQIIHPKSGKGFSLLPLTNLLLVELNQKAGCRGGNIIHFVDMQRAGQRRMGGYIKRIINITNPQ